MAAPSTPIQRTPIQHSTNNQNFDYLAEKQDSFSIIPSGLQFSPLPESTLDEVAAGIELLRSQNTAYLTEQFRAEKRDPLQAEVTKPADQANARTVASLANGEPVTVNGVEVRASVRPDEMKIKRRLIQRSLI